MEKNNKEYNNTLNFLRESLFNLYTILFSKTISKFGGEAAKLLSKEKDQVVKDLLNSLKSRGDLDGEDAMTVFYTKYLPLLGFKSEFKTLNEEVLFLKISKCPIMNIGIKYSNLPLCNLICLPASNVICEVLKPGFNTEIVESKWEGEENCKIYIKKPAEMITLEEVLDKITDLEPYNCPYRHVETPCVFCEDIECDKCDYEEFRFNVGMARKCVNSAVLNFSLSLKDELDVYILHKLTNRLGEDGVFRVMKKPEQGYNLSFFFMSKTGENRDKVKNTILKFIQDIKGILSEGRVVINNWVEKKRAEITKTFREEGTLPKKIIRVVECPHCSTKIRFTIDSSQFEKYDEYPVPFQIQHGDHAFTTYFDEDLNIIKVEKNVEE
ncbi:MAG: hypothetical protein ACTSYQ_00055 [Candidatus Odinarchaeia archaeon]